MHRIARFERMSPPSGFELERLPVPVDLQADFSTLGAETAEAFDPRVDSVLDQARRQFTRLPLQGTPAAELTDRDKLALAIAAGVPTRFEMHGTMLTLHSVPLATADRPGGGYLVAWVRNESITTKEVL